MSLVLCQGTAQHLPMADESIDCCVSSPPYWLQRVYAGLPPEAWPAGAFAPEPGRALISVPAWYGCLGSEPSLDLYLWHMVLVLREAKRVLKPTGVCWWNVGDAFANTPGNGRGGETVEGGLPHRSASAKTHTSLPPGSLLLLPHRIALAAAADGWIVRNDTVWHKGAPMPESINGSRWEQARCACLTPQRTYSGQQGYATQGHRESVSGTNGLSAAPSTVADPACPHCHGTGRTAEWVLRRGSWRHTRSHEFILHMVKSMGYWSNAEAVREGATHAGDDRKARAQYAHKSMPEGLRNGIRPGVSIDTATRNPRTVLSTLPKPADHLTALVSWLAHTAPDVLAAYEEAQGNPGSVVSPAPSPLNLAHYAAFSPSLPEQFIKASCPERVCVLCKAPWAVVIYDTSTPPVSANGSRFDRGKSAHHGHVQAGERTVKRSTGMLRPTCAHYCTCHKELLFLMHLEHDNPCPVCQKVSLSVYQPGIVADPFLGSGTTLLVARALGRHGVGIEASDTYIQLAQERLGMTDLARWEGHGPAAPREDHTTLPLFGG